MLGDEAVIRKCRAASPGVLSSQSVNDPACRHHTHPDGNELIPPPYRLFKPIADEEALRRKRMHLSPEFDAVERNEALEVRAHNRLSGGSTEAQTSFGVRDERTPRLVDVNTGDHHAPRKEACQQEQSKHATALSHDVPPSFFGDSAVHYTHLLGLCKLALF